MIALVPNTQASSSPRPYQITGKTRQPHIRQNDDWPSLPELPGKSRQCLRSIIAPIYPRKGDNAPRDFVLVAERGYATWLAHRPPNMHVGVLFVLQIASKQKGLSFGAAELKRSENNDHAQTGRE